LLDTEPVWRKSLSAWAIAYDVTLRTRKPRAALTRVLPGPGSATGERLRREVPDARVSVVLVGIGFKREARNVVGFEVAEG